MTDQPTTPPRDGIKPYEMTKRERAHLTVKGKSPAAQEAFSYFFMLNELTQQYYSDGIAPTKLADIELVLRELRNYEKALTEANEITDNPKEMLHLLMVLSPKIKKLECEFASRLKQIEQIQRKKAEEERCAEGKRNLHKLYALFTDSDKAPRDKTEHRHKK